MKVIAGLFASISIVLAGCGGGGGASTLGNSDTGSIKPLVCVSPQVFNDAGNGCRIPPFKTSYENKNSINFEETQVPEVRSMGIPKFDQYEQGSLERSITFGDFFQEGKYSAFVATSVARNLYGDPNLGDSPAVVYFLRKGVTGGWVDETSKLIENKDDRYSCVWPSYSLTADFNNDGIPDVYMACTGADRWWDTYAENLARCCSKQIVYLSQQNGKYKKIELPDLLYGHKAAAGDINGDGCIDVVTANAAIFSDGLPVVYLGNCDGTFRSDKSLIPQNIKDTTGRLSGLYAVDLIPINGRLDLFIGSGRTQKQQGLVWLKGSKSSAFFDPISIKLPDSKYRSVNAEYQFPLDVIYDGANLYLLANQTSGTLTEWAVLKASLSDLSRVDVIYTHLRTSIPWTPATPDGEIGRGVAQMKTTGDGYLVAYSGACRLPPSTNTGMCSMKLKR